MPINPLTPTLLGNVGNPGVQTGPTFAGGSAGFQAINPLTGAPPTGLLGAENALTSAADNALRVLRSGRNFGINELQQTAGQAAGAIQAGAQQGAGTITGAGEQGVGTIERAIGAFDPFTQQGTSANDLQAALSGAQGVEAQRTALANLIPVNEFLQQQGEQAVTRQASALGGLGGGNVLKELTRFGQGLASTTLQEQFDRLGGVANRGLASAQSVGNLRGQQGQLQLRAGEGAGQLQAAGGLGAGRVLEGAGNRILDARQQTAANIANVFGGAGGTLAAGRTNVGEQLASAVGGTSSALSSLVNQQGEGLSDIVGQAGGNLANLLTGSGEAQAGSQQQLATLLANLAAGQGSQVAGLPGIPGVQQSPGILSGLGDLSAGLGGLLAGL